MSHVRKIQKLADFLINMGLEAEASELLHFIRKQAEVAPSVDDWYSLINEVDSNYVDTAYPVISKYLKEASKHLFKADSGLKGVTPEDIKSITDKIPIETLIKAALKKNNLIKYSNVKSENYMKKIATFCVEQGFIETPNYKKANWWDFTKMVGGGVARYVLPFVSLLFAIVNFYYCAIEFSKLMSELPEAGLSWYEPLMPGKLLDASKENQDSPALLAKIAKATKTSKVFVDEFISLVANSIDGVKDVIFLIADLLTAGASIAIDLGISFIIMLLEWSVEGEVLPHYANAISFIRNKAAGEIKSHHMNEFKTKYKFETLELDEEAI